MLGALSFYLGGNLGRRKAERLYRIVSTNFPNLRRFFLTFYLLWVPSPLDELYTRCTGLYWRDRRTPTRIPLDTVMGIEVISKCFSSRVKIEIDNSEEADAELAKDLTWLRRYLKLARASRYEEEIRWKEASRKIRPGRIRKNEVDVLAESLESTLLLR